MSDCLFCAIVRKEIPAQIVFENDDVIAFRDINPTAPIHILVVPKTHSRDAVDLAQTDPALAGALLAAAGDVAAQEGISDFRLVFNTGAEAGQTVFHTHLHVLGGRALQWPPG